MPKLYNLITNWKLKPYTDSIPVFIPVSYPVSKKDSEKELKPQIKTTIPPHVVNDISILIDNFMFKFGLELPNSFQKELINYLERHSLDKDNYPDTNNPKDLNQHNKLG